ncbi:MAG: response regulator [Deltaproteobacteria bacterium]|nr:MAG: response regulator [Deltaproteobacteria bacterium]
MAVTMGCSDFVEFGNNGRPQSGPPLNPIAQSLLGKFLQAMILIVDNDAVVRNSLVVLLRARGHEVTAMRDGTEALTLLDNRHFDLVITDLVMPKLTAFHLVAQIRSRWRQTPILLISAYVSQDAGKSFQATPPNLCISQPNGSNRHGSTPARTDRH